MAKISQWSLKKKIIYGVAVLILIWIGWSIFGGENKATTAVLELPDGQILIENENNDEIELEVKIGSNATNLTGVNPEVLEETVIYITSRYSASAAKVYEDIETDIEVAFFGPDGSILEIYEIPANSSETITPDERYQHVLIATSGFFEENDISVNNESIIQ
ncbi:MAG: hypothetical protein ACOCQS_01595 [Bacillota bacterium]